MNKEAKEKDPEAKKVAMGPIAKAMGAKWKALSTEEKAPYEEMAKGKASSLPSLRPPAHRPGRSVTAANWWLSVRVPGVQWTRCATRSN